MNLFEKIIFYTTIVGCSSFIIVMATLALLVYITFGEF